MAIYKNGKEVAGVFMNNVAIVAIYKGTKLVWEAINSCFGKGCWINTKAWIHKDGWRNN